MRKLVWNSGILMCLLAGCIKADKNQNQCNYPDSIITAPAAEVSAVQSYLTSNNITATQHPTGFFYTITNQGTGPAIVNLCSTLRVKYIGKLTNGSVFDDTGASAVDFQLGQVITGWQKGMPLISKGGKITLYIPPTLGYGNIDKRNSAGVVVIPANSILIFDIELIDIG
ncbi:MAG: FKBP-type peptidyl-prolyl cis-trans isomerase [Ginsengibacter sp.]